MRQKRKTKNSHKLRRIKNPGDEDKRMQIEIITDKKNELEIELKGESHTICNPLRKILMEDDDVKYAVYSIDHPIVGEPILKIKAKDPKKSLKKAAKKLQEETKDFKDQIEKI